MHSRISCGEKRFARFGTRPWISTCFPLLEEVVFDGMEGLCMPLKRLAYPCRYNDMIPRFGRPIPEQPSYMHKEQTRRAWRNKLEIQNYFE